MRHAMPLLILFVFLAAIPTSAQGILPNSFAGWTAGTTLAPTVGFKVPNTEAAAHEYGYSSGESAAYTRDNGGLIEVTLYRMKDPTGASGLSSYLRSPDMERSGTNEHSFPTAPCPASASMSIARTLLWDPSSGTESLRSGRHCRECKPPIHLTNSRTRARQPRYSEP